jgi:adenylate cyclase
VSTEPDAELIRYLAGQGAEPEELREAVDTGILGPLALELALRSPGERVPFAQGAELAGLELDEATAVWRALGFPDPLESAAMLSPAQVETLRVLGEMGGLLVGADTGLELARVIGGAVAQIAEAIVDAFRLNVEMPRRHAGDPEAEVIQDYARIASVAIPALGRAITDALGSHLVAVSRSTWALDAERATVTRERTVGFADLVGYTPSARLASPAGLAATISRFETHVGDAVGRLGGRVVKLIGDEAMFILGDAGTACELALELTRRIEQDQELPSVRIALASGPVVSHHGDYYGDVVNLAARLVKIAEPGEVLVSESLAEAEAGSGRFRFDVFEVPPLKGYDHSVGAYRLQSPPL